MHIIIQVEVHSLSINTMLQKTYFLPLGKKSVLESIYL